MSKNLKDYISATPYLIDALSMDGVETQEEAKQVWLLAYHFIKNILEEKEKNEQ